MANKEQQLVAAMCDLTTTRYNERMIDDLVEEYICKFLDDVSYEWAKNLNRKTITIQDVGIVWIFDESRVTLQGNPQKARTMLQIPQCRKEVEEEKQEKLRIHRRVGNKATQTKKEGYRRNK